MQPHNPSYQECLGLAKSHLHPGNFLKTGHTSIDNVTPTVIVANLGTPYLFLALVGDLKGYGKFFAEYLGHELGFVSREA